MKIRKDLKRQFKICILSRFDRPPGWRTFFIGVFKFKEIPPDGMNIKEIQHKGFMFAFNFWLPIVR